MVSWPAWPGEPIAGTTTNVTDGYRKLVEFGRFDAKRSSSFALVFCAESALKALDVGVGESLQKALE